MVGGGGGGGRNGRLEEFEGYNERNEHFKEERNKGRYEKIGIFSPLLTCSHIASCRIKVTRKIPFISVHLVKHLKEEVVKDDAMTCVDKSQGKSSGEQLSPFGAARAEAVEGVCPLSMGGPSCADVAQESKVVAKMKQEGRQSRRKRKKKRPNLNSAGIKRKSPDKNKGQ